MEIVWLLVAQILVLFIVILFGYSLVKTKILKSSQSLVLSLVVLYIAQPAAIIGSFMQPFSPEILQGLLLAFAAALASQLLFIGLARLFGGLFGWNRIERASVIYSNCGNLIIPLVSYILGEEWIIYSCAFIAVQTFLVWTHGRMMITGMKKLDAKAIFLNPGVIATLVGILIFLLRIPLPEPVHNLASMCSGMLAPLAMLIIGMILAQCPVKQVISTRSYWSVSFYRLIAFPLISILLFQVLKLVVPVQEADSILLITLLACCAPAANMIVQFAQLAGKHEKEASAINVLTTLLALISMPLMVLLYQIL